MIPENIERTHIEKAIAEIDQNGIQNGAQSSTYDLINEGKSYPPKLVLSLANKFANGQELDRSTFQGGENTEAFTVLRNHGFHIKKKTPIKKLVQEFLEQAKTDNLKTKHYPSNYKGLDVSISFGVGNSARIPWIAFLRPPNKVMDGIYPGLLFYKEFNLLILTYGKSETNASSFTWSVNAETINEFFKRKFDVKPDRYGKSLIKAVYDLNDGIDYDKLQNDLDEMINQYKAISFNENTVNDSSEKYKSINYWIFQCNPAIYDLENALKNDAVHSWTVAAHKDKIKVGDKAIIWVTGSEAKCLALGEILSEPQYISETSREKEFYVKTERGIDSTKVRINITHNFIGQPVFWNDLKELPEFKNFKAGHQGTNFSATKEEFITIKEIGEANSRSYYPEVKKQFPVEKVEKFLNILRKFVVDYNLDPEDERVSFNVRPERKRLVFIIGNRYALMIQKRRNETEFSFISPRPVSKDHGSFTRNSGEVEMYWNKVSDLTGFDKIIEEGFRIELERENKTPYRKFTDPEFIADVFNKGNNMKTIHLNGNSVYKLSMGKFLKDPKLKHENLVEYFEENSLGVMDGNTKKGQGKRFREKLKLNDIVYVTYGQDKLGSLYRVIGETQKLDGYINDKIGDNEHLGRKLEEIATSKIGHTRDLHDRRDWLPSGNSTLYRIPELHEANEILFIPYYGLKLTNNVEFEEAAKKEELNRILYGPPGTGKTYKSKEIAVQIANPSFTFLGNLSPAQKREKIVEEYNRLFNSGQIVFTTFHQSFSYEDFIEGIKPLPPKPDGDVGYEVQDGIFKRLCIKAKEKKQSVNFDEAYTQFINEVIEKGDLELHTPFYKKPFKVRINSNESAVAIPQTETKTEMSITKEMLRNYILTGEIKDWKPYTTSIAAYLKDNYNVEVQESRNETKNYVLIIDEINRGNVSSILGELITLLEPDKRQGMEEELSVELPYSKEPFTVPSNLYVIGTMNTADRSVEALDTALRRRFAFEEVMPNSDLLREIYFEGFNLKEVLDTINERIEALLDRDHTIGHSYFIKIPSGDIEALQEAFENKIIPLLQEYFYHDYEKIALILGEGFIDRKEAKISFAKFSKIDLPDVMPSYHLKVVQDIEEAIYTLLNRSNEAEE